ncbi:MAG: HDOD domain-containing protein [Longimicrobiales bacterium]
MTTAATTAGATTPRARAEELVRNAGSVGSPPLIYQRLVEVINHPRSAAGDIAGVIAEDQGLTTRLLKVVNSAFFSLPWRVDTVSAAVRVVGTRQIRDLAVATAVLRLFDDVPAELVDMESFWHHSLACGVTARVLASHRGEDNIERYFVAGLLHDVGRLILFTGAGAEMTAAMERARTEGCALFLAEREEAGVDHAVVGGALMDQWSFPPALREAVRYHHEPRRASQFPVETAAVHVADVVATAMAWGRSGETRVPPLDKDAWDTVGLDVDLAPMILDDAGRQMEAALHLIQGREGA